MYMFTVVRRWGVFYCFVDMWIALLYVIRITATLVLELLLWCDVFLKIIFHICINKNANTIICIPSRNGKQVQQERKNNSHCTKLIHDPFQMGGGGGMKQTTHFVFCIIWGGIPCLFEASKFIIFFCLLQYIILYEYCIKRLHKSINIYLFEYVYFFTFLND